MSISALTISWKELGSMIRGLMGWYRYEASFGKEHTAPTTGEDKKRSVLERLPGFPRAAHFLASDPDKSWVLFRRFDEASIRNLLYLEARVAALEKVQNVMEVEDFDYYRTKTATSSAACSWEEFAMLGMDFEEAGDLWPAMDIWVSEREKSMDDEMEVNERKYGKADPWPKPEAQQVRVDYHRRQAYEQEQDRRKNRFKESTEGLPAQDPPPKQERRGPQFDWEAGDTGPQREAQTLREARYHRGKYEQEIRQYWPPMPASPEVDVNRRRLLLGYSDTDRSLVEKRWRVARALQKALRDYGRYPVLSNLPANALQKML
jgi:hypothetical protein